MTKDKYLLALKNLVKIKLDENLNQNEQELDRLFNWVLEIIISKINDEKFNDVVIIIEEELINEIKFGIVLKYEGKYFISRLKRNDFYNVVNNFTNIFKNVHSSNNIYFDVRSYISISGIQIVIVLIK